MRRTFEVSRGIPELISPRFNQPASINQIKSMAVIDRLKLCLESNIAR